MHRPRWSIPLLALFLVACGGDDATGPSNQPPHFTENPSAVSPGGWLLNVVPGDPVAFTARAIDPDIEDVEYQWDIVRQSGGGYVVVTDAGTLQDSGTSGPVWLVGDFVEPVRIRCTITDGKESRSELVARAFATATPLEDLTVSADQTLTAAASPYVVIGDLVVEATAVLTIEAGVELQVRPDRRNSTSWERRAIKVRGSLVAEGLSDPPVVIRGGYSIDPDAGSGTAQYEGIFVEDGGSAELVHCRISDAEIGLRVLSDLASTATSSSFRDCATGVQVERGTGSVLTDVYIRDCSTGLQLNSASVLLDGGAIESCSTYGIDVDASVASGGLDVRRVTFSSNPQAHVRMRGEVGNLMTATVRGSNFLRQSGKTIAFNLSSPCFLYSLDLTGNFWGAPATPSQINGMFEGGQSCDANVLSWTDSDCGGDPDACDWSNEPWN